MRRLLSALAAVLLSGAAHAAQSQCYGTVSKGRLQGGVQLPLYGANFTAYSAIAAGAGRNYLHAQAARIVLEAYAGTGRSMPDVHFVYGETGLAAGGPFAPHRTHQNGLSADFFVPVRDAAGRSVPLPTPQQQRFGYDIEFDSTGRYGAYRIDFRALAEHVYQLDLAARASGSSIRQVIIEPSFMPQLLATPRGKYLSRKVNFMKGKPWWRHDEHYHVDFAAHCRPL